MAISFPFSTIAFTVVAFASLAIACSDAPAPEEKRATAGHLDDGDRAREPAQQTPAPQQQQQPAPARDPGLVGPEEVDALKQYYRETETVLHPYQDGQPGVFYERVSNSDTNASSSSSGGTEGGSTGDDDDG